MPTVNEAAPIGCPLSSHRLCPPKPPRPPRKKNLKLSFSKKKLKASKGFQFVSLRPENHIFCFKVPEMPLKAHASSAVGAKNRSLQLCIAGRRQPMTCGGSGALHDYQGRGHPVFGMHSHVTHVAADVPLCKVGASLAVRQAPVAL
jgi:hypothetical protein